MQGGYETRNHAAPATGVGASAADEPLDPTSAALLRAMPEATMIVDDAGRIVVLNAQAERLFGYAAHELVGQPVEMLLPQRLRARHAGHRAHYVADPHTRPMGIGLDLLAQRRHGSEVPVEISLSPLHTAPGIRVVSVIHDIGDRKRAADE